MSTVKQQYKDLLSGCDNDHESYYIKGYSVFDKTDDSQVGIFKPIYHSDKGIFVRIYIDMVDKFVDVGWIKTDDLTDAQRKMKICDVLDLVDDELN